MCSIIYDVKLYILKLPENDVFDWKEYYFCRSNCAQGIFLRINLPSNESKIVYLRSLT